MKKRLRMVRGGIFRSMRRAVVPVVLLAGICNPPAFAQRSFYRLTSIADTQPQFPYTNLTQFPCQNAEDRVDFEATLTGGVQGMFTRLDLGGVDSIADTGSSPYESFGDCSINGNGLVLFSALQKLPNEYAQVLLLGGGYPLLTLLTAKADGTYNNFGAYQLNAQGKAVTLANRADGSGSVILTNGPLTGITKIIADTSPSSPYISLGDFPSINSFNTVAFTAMRRDGAIEIITIAEDGTVTQLIDNTGPFAGFDDIDLNDNGSLAFDGHQWGGLGGVWRIDTKGGSTSITKITDANATGSSDFTAVSINDAGQVAYSFRDDINGFVSTVGIGSGNRFFVFGLGPIVLGPGAVVFGRTVNSVDIGRDSLNNLGQIVLHIDFDDGSQMIARADPVNPWQNIVATAAAFALSTGSGSGAGMHTGVSLPLNLLMLDFDATFLTNKGELKVLLGDRLLKSIPAGSRGMRQSFRVPIDLREKTRRITPLKAQDLNFQLTGAPGAVVHIGNISIPGEHLSSTQTDEIARWHFDTKSGGWAGFVDATLFPVEIKLLSEKQEQSAPAKEVSVAILSTKTFDATKDIERDTLHFGGMPVTHEAETKGGNHPRCSERDVNGDQRPDLVCGFEPPTGKAAGSPQKTARLQGMTPYGWMIEGRAD
jgi:hypothetical protein